MTLQPDTGRFITPEDYLAKEELADTRSEYFNGEVFAMVGATFAHNMIVSNLTGFLFNHLKGKPCHVLGSAQKVWISSENSFLYPDLMVVCGEPSFYDKRQTALLNPVLIVEVLSPSTEAEDRGHKFQLYEQLGSLTDYLLVAQDGARIEQFTRQPDGDWVRHLASGLDATLDIPSIECRLPLGDIYNRVEFQPIIRPL